MDWADLDLKVRPWDRVDRLEDMDRVLLVGNLGYIVIFYRSENLKYTLILRWVLMILRVWWISRMWRITRICMTATIWRHTAWWIRSWRGSVAWMTWIT